MIPRPSRFSRASRTLTRVLACFAIAHASAHAATFDVTNAADSGTGSRIVPVQPFLPLTTDFVDP